MANAARILEANVILYGLYLLPNIDTPTPLVISRGKILIAVMFTTFYLLQPAENISHSTVFILFGLFCYSMLISIVSERDMIIKWNNKQRFQPHKNCTVWPSTHMVRRPHRIISS